VSLGVLGLIAGLTIPAVVNSVTISKERNAAKEAYQALSSAVQLAYMEGTISGMSSADRSLTNPNSAFVQWFRNAFSGLYCENGDVTGKCARIGWYLHYSNNAARVILPTGAVIVSVDDSATWGAGFGVTTQSFMIDGNGGEKATLINGRELFLPHLLF
jgi:type II secretory pathway pseudopilin PulG